MVSVGIIGGSGYMGGEALRVLLRHPQADIAWVTSRSPGPIERVHPNLGRVADVHFGLATLQDLGGVTAGTKPRNETHRVRHLKQAAA
jgi:N-acetyl-gamma-glutamylphosphate reductase